MDETREPRRWNAANVSRTNGLRRAGGTAAGPVKPDAAHVTGSERMILHQLRWYRELKKRATFVVYRPALVSGLMPGTGAFFVGRSCGLAKREFKHQIIKRKVYPTGEGGKKVTNYVTDE